MPNDTSSHSRLREKILEHIFVSDVLGSLWRAGHRDMEVLRGEVDSGGYDVVLVHRRVIRHVQLKASAVGAKTDVQKVHTALGTTPSGCVVWFRHDTALRIVPPYLWFGGRPNERLPDLGNRMAKQTRGNAQGTKGVRPAMRIVTRGRFEKVSTLDLLIQRLFRAEEDPAAARPL